MGWKTFRPGRIRCPHCGYEGTTPPEKHHTYDTPPFLWVEDTIISWPVVAVKGVATEGGKIQMGFESSYGEESGSPRIECMNCYGEFPVPEGATADWVDDDEIDWGEVA